MTLRRRSGIRGEMGLNASGLSLSRFDIGETSNEMMVGMTGDADCRLTWSLGFLIMRVSDRGVDLRFGFGFGSIPCGIMYSN